MAQSLRIPSWPADLPASRTLATPPTVRVRKNRAAFRVVQKRREARVTASQVPVPACLLVRQHCTELPEDRELYVQSLCNLVAVKQRSADPESRWGL